MTSLRKESVNGRDEWVIVDHEGPGCLTKFWTPFFYYGFNNRVGPKIRIYIDGADEPVIDEYFIELLTNNQWPSSYGNAPPPQNTLKLPPPYAGFTARAGNLYLPIPFAKSCKVTLSSRAFYHIVNYRAYPQGTAVKSFTIEDYRNASELLGRTSKQLPAAGGVRRRTLLRRKAARSNQESKSIYRWNRAPQRSVTWNFRSTRPPSPSTLSCCVQPSSKSASTATRPCGRPSATSSAAPTH